MDMLIALFILTGYATAATLRPLVCNSVNRIISHQPKDYIYISTKNSDCVYLFEGPFGSAMDVHIYSLTSGNLPCSSSKITLYDIRTKKFLPVTKDLCQGLGETRFLTDSNLAVVTSSMVAGSFTISVRLQGGPTEIESNHVNRRSSNDNLVELTPPVPFALNFYDEFGLRAQPSGNSGTVDSGFRPSVQYPDYNIRGTSYGVPMYNSQSNWGFAPCTCSSYNTMDSYSVPESNGGPYANSPNSGSNGTTSNPITITPTSGVEVTTLETTTSGASQTANMTTEPGTTPESNTTLPTTTAATTTEISVTTEPPSTTRRSWWWLGRTTANSTAETITLPPLIPVPIPEPEENVE